MDGERREYIRDRFYQEINGTKGQARRGGALRQGEMDGVC